MVVAFLKRTHEEMLVFVALQSSAVWLKIMIMLLQTQTRFNFFLRHLFFKRFHPNHAFLTMMFQNKILRRFGSGLCTWSFLCCCYCTHLRNATALRSVEMYLEQVGLEGGKLDKTYVLVCEDEGCYIEEVIPESQVRSYQNIQMY